MVRGSAVDEEEKPGEPPPEVLRFVVLRDAQFTHNGHRVSMKTGKVIDSLNYDVRHLRRQGVHLKQLAPGDDGFDAIGN
jgi:hypothetical protein